MTVAPEFLSTSVRPPLPRHERSRRTAELLAAASSHQSEECRHDLHDEVLTMNLSVAYALARRFARRGIDLQDLEQVACEALVKAVRRFDPSRDHDFLSFAVPTIRGELQRHFRDLGWAVRPTRRIQETQWRAARAEDDLTARLGRRPDPGEVAAELGITREEYAEAQSAHGCFRPASLDKPLTIEGDGDGLGATLSAEDRELLDCEARIMLMPAVRELSERERRVLYLRFFLDYSQAEIGNEIGVGQAQVSRIINRALAELREMMTGETSAHAPLRVVRPRAAVPTVVG